MTLNDSPVFEVQKVEALFNGGGNFLDPTEKPLRLSKVLTHELPHLRCDAALQYFLWNPPHLDILPVEIGDLDFIGHQDRIRGGFQRCSHGGERLGKLSGALLEDFVGPTDFLLRKLANLKDA